MSPSASISGWRHINKNQEAVDEEEWALCISNGSIDGSGDRLYCGAVLAVLAYF